MEDIDAGALVGWKSQDLGKRIVLNLQTMHRSDDGENELRERAVMIDRSQAVLLANSLYEMTGQSRPRRRTLMQTIFGN